MLLKPERRWQKILLPPPNLLLAGGKLSGCFQTSNVQLVEELMAFFFLKVATLVSLLISSWYLLARHWLV